MSTLSKRQKAARDRITSAVKITYAARPEVTALEVWKSKPSRGGDWRFRAKAKSGELVCTGTGYTRKWSAARGGVRMYPTAKVIFIAATAVQG